MTNEIIRQLKNDIRGNIRDLVEISGVENAKIFFMKEAADYLPEQLRNAKTQTVEVQSNDDGQITELTKENQKLRSQVEQLSRGLNSVSEIDETRYTNLLRDYETLQTEYQSLKDLRKVSDVLTNTNESLNEVEPIFGLEETVVKEVKPTKTFRKFSNWVENYEDNLDGKVKAVIHVPKDAEYLPNQVIVELH